MFFDNSGAPVKKNYSLDEFSVSTMEGVKASFSQSLKETFSGATWRDNELIRANIGRGEVHYGAYSPSLGYSKPITGTEEKLTTEQAQQQIKDAELPLVVPEEGYTQTALDIIMNRKREELVRKKQMDDSRGFFTTGAKFSAAMVAQILDPVNVAASFVPVVGVSRYAKWVASASSATGRAGVRAGVGAAEGLVGAAIVEPAIYMAMTREQADYTMADSLVNVGLGTVLGGGLHMGAGAIGDAVKKGRTQRTTEPQGSTAKAVENASPETRDAMLKTALSMEAQGKQLDVESVAATDVNLNSMAKAAETQKTIPYTGVLSRLKRDVYQGEVDLLIKSVDSFESTKGVNPSEHSMDDAINKLGGINREAAVADGVDPATFKRNKTFRKDGGKGFDEMAELLNESGYRAANGDKLTANDLVDLVISEDAKLSYSDAASMDDNAVLIRDLRSQGYTVEQIKTALNKAKDGKKLGKTQQEIVENALLSIEQRRIDQYGDLQARPVKGADQEEAFITFQEAESEAMRLIGDSDLSESQFDAIEFKLDALENNLIDPNTFLDDVRAIIEPATTPPHINESQSVQNTVKTGFAPENSRGVDKNASIYADEQIAKAEQDIDTNLSDIEQMFSEYEKMVGETTNLKAYDEAIIKAEQDATALEAATMCRLNK